MQDKNTFFGFTIVDDVRFFIFFLVILTDVDFVVGFTFSVEAALEQGSESLKVSSAKVHKIFFVYTICILYYMGTYIICSYCFGSLL